MAKLTPAQAREKHARRLKGAIEDMRIGIEAVTEAPGKKAAAAQEKMRAKLTESVRDGTWARRVAGITLEEWKKLMLEKGLGRIAAGIDGSADKVERFFEQLFPFQDALKTKIEALPDLTLEDSINRMNVWVRGMATFKPK